MRTVVDPETGEEVGSDSAEGSSTECQICHVVVSYVREALNNKATEEEIEEVRRRLFSGASGVAARGFCGDTAPRLWCRVRWRDASLLGREGEQRA